MWEGEIYVAKRFLMGIVAFSFVWIFGIVILSQVLTTDIIVVVAFSITMLTILFYIVMFMITFTKGGRNFSEWLRGKWFLLTTGEKLNKKINIGKDVRFKNKKCITIDNNVSIGNGAEFFPVENGYPSKIVIGKRVVIGDYNRFASMNSVVIDDDVLFAAYVHITDHSHEYRNNDLPIMDQGIFTKGPVHIKKGAWIGLRASILSGVTIGEHAVVAAGSIVTKDVPDYSVVAGCPAKVISKYDANTGKWVKMS